MTTTVSPSSMKGTALCGLLLAVTTSGCIDTAKATESTAPIASLAQPLVPAKGTASSLDIGSWNIEWFGSTGNGPNDEALQRENVYDVIAGADLDVWGVEEIVSAADFNTLLSQLPGYEGFLANAPNVVDGSAFYSTSEQKVGILYKSAVASVQDARVVLTANDYEFGTRPPLQVTLRVTLNGHTEDVIVIVLHAKCCDNASSWQRRRDASIALKSYLDSNYPTQKVWVIGDFNDDLDTSITPGQPSPYANFLSDSGDYSFLTKPLSDSGMSSTVGYPDTIDHHLASNEAAALLVAGSAEIYRVDEFITDYGDTTSDHYPILSRYLWSDSGTDEGSTQGQVTINEILANEPGSDTAGEFVELVNISSTPASLDGWTLSDGQAIRHVFASGLTLQPGKAIVVFGASAAIPVGLSNAVTASTGTLSLANGGDTVTLRNGSGSTVQAFTYGSSLASVDGVSMNRDPDGTADGPFVRHDSLSTLPRSAGTRSNDAAW